MKVLLSVLPHFQNKSFLVAHLGNACISAYIKEKSPQVDIKTIDLRTEPDVNEIWGDSFMPQITDKKDFVSDIYDLPLIASVITKYNIHKSMRHILEPVSDVIFHWALERDMNPQKVINVLKKTNNFAMRNLKHFKGYDIVGFSLYTTNLYMSVFMAILIKIN